MRGRVRLSPFFFIVFLIYSPLAYSSNLKLLVLPLSDGTSSVYSVNLKKDCSFLGVEEIQTTRFKVNPQKSKFVEYVNLLQNKFNFEIDNLYLSSNEIIFNLKIASNLQFKYFFDPKNCTLVKTLYFNDHSYDLDEIYIEYDSQFFSPVIKKLQIINKGMSTDLLLYPWALHGIISTYEFNGGIALKIQSNFRKKDLNSSQVEVLPAFIFRYGPFFLSKDGLGSLLFHREKFSVLGMGIIEGEPYESVGLQKRKQGFFLGTILKYDMYELINYNDFFSEKGFSLKFNMAPEFYLSLDYKFKPQVFIQYWDWKYVDYYFGVKDLEESSGMKSFRGEVTLNVGMNLELMHFVGNWTYVENIGIKKFGKEVYSSPTVELKNDLQIVVSLLYKFL